MIVADFIVKNPMLVSFKIYEVKKKKNLGQQRKYGIRFSSMLILKLVHIFRLVS